MIFSSIGPVLQSIFAIVATVQRGTKIPVVPFLMEGMTNILQIGTQVAFYAHAKSVQIQVNRYEEMSVQEIRRERSILQGVILYFAVCNFAVWFVDSFIEVRTSETGWQRQYYDSWPVIYNIFNPLALAFRLNSFFLFLKVLLTKYVSTQ